jgi:hypothetical protein
LRFYRNNDKISRWLKQKLKVLLKLCSRANGRNK